LPGPDFRPKYFKLREYGKSFCELLKKAYLSRDQGILAALRDLPASEIRQQPDSITEKLWELEDVIKVLVPLLQDTASDCESGRKYVAEVCAKAPALGDADKKGS
jgi:hypothetical protein